MGPNPAITEQLPDDTDCTIPLGKYQNTGVTSTDPPSLVLILSQLTSDSALLYNEFVVYDTSQVKIRYLIHVNFNY